ncbi:DUF2782 domain-containing protein [Herbaspirillum sp. GCM10030257]|uniref:DUF2782 domain-containing protein n=1 Tax=Herbaspirillum sp. GCM10030257 TaxID=3273393 RepID=UPI00361B32E0
MMRTLMAMVVTAAGIAAAAMPLSTLAQQSTGNGNGNGPAPRPPQLQPLEEGEEPAVTIRPPDNKGKIDEKRAPGGRVTEIKVTSGGSTYYLKPDVAAGSALPGDAQNSGLRAAQWEVLEFDLSRSKDAKEADAVPTEATDTAAVPPPPAPK